jgi:hypothetical protein
VLKKTLSAFVIISALTAQPVAAQGAPKLDDQTLTDRLVGTWINPPDSPDYENFASSETYNADGSYEYREYDDKDCRIVSALVKSRWHVWNGVVITEYDGGKSLSDHIVSMDAERMVLRSVDDGVTFFRTRSTTCPPPATARK